MKGVILLYIAIYLVFSNSRRGFYGWVLGWLVLGVGGGWRLFLVSRQSGRRGCIDAFWAEILLLIFVLCCLE